MASVPDGYEADLRLACARVVARSQNSDLVFLGRSPEHLFDYLSGALHRLPNAPSLTLLQFSKADHGGRLDRFGNARELTAGERRAFLAYLKEERLDPLSIAVRPRAVRFVDLVSMGSTFVLILKLMRELTREQRADWNVVERRLGVLGLIRRTKNSPNTERWQQQARWTSLGLKVRVKNVSVPPAFWYFIGGSTKVTPSHHRGRWPDPSAATPRRSEEALKALRRSAAIYEMASTKAERAALARALAEQPEISERWLRRMVGEMRTARPG